MTRKRLERRIKRAILVLYYKTGDWSQSDLGRLFGITRGRVSQIVNNYYNEFDGLGFVNDSEE